MRGDIDQLRDREVQGSFRCCRRLISVPAHETEDAGMQMRGVHSTDDLLREDSEPRSVGF